MASSSSSDLATLTKAIQALVEQQATNNKLVRAVIDRLAGAKPAAAGAGNAEAEVEALLTKGKRGRKPKADKAAKDKPAPLPVGDGVIRFGSASEGDYREFSSFFKSPFLVDGKEYISVASYFHSQKFAGSDDDFAEEIRTQKNPALTRAKASSKDHAPRADWSDEDKLRIMRSALVAKFSANSVLRRKLLATGIAPIESTIEEEMRVKGFWSIGEDGSGANHTGKLLASVRAELLGRGGDESEKEVPAVAPAAKKAAPAAKKAAPPPSADSDSDESEDEEEAPKALAKAPVKAPAKVAPVAVDDSEDSDDSDEEDD